MAQCGKVFYRFLIVALMLVSLPVQASEFMVLGVIAYENSTDGVALVKKLSSAQAYAVRVGESVGDGIWIQRITREYVYFKRGSSTEKIKVGETLTLGMMQQESLPSSGSGAVERNGSQVRVTQAYRDHIIKHDLSRVLMQAAAIPQYTDGELKGFKIWDIDEGSIYDQVGLANGDVITAINGQPLTDVGRTVQLLQSLRNDSRADVTLIRKGQEQTLSISVE